MADIKTTFSEDELFLLEMAIDEVLWRIQDYNSPWYQRYNLLNQKINSLRKSPNNNKEDEIICINDILIEDLDFSIRTYNSIKRAYINTVGELNKLSPTQISHIKNLGKKGAQEVEDKLRELGCERPLDVAF